jgi:hypothetical protein
MPSASAYTWSHVMAVDIVMHDYPMGCSVHVATTVGGGRKGAERMDDCIHIYNRWLDNFKRLVVPLNEAH